MEYHDAEHQGLEEQLRNRIFELLPLWIKTVNLQPNTVLFVNARKIDPVAMAAAFGQAFPEGLLGPHGEMISPVYIIGVDGNPEASMMGKAELEYALKILNGEVA
jgi:hypothetical protein